MKLATRLLAPAALAGAAAALASGASAATTGVSANWAGYVTSGVDGVTGAAKSFTSVSGTWVQPAASCTSATSSGSTASAFWVGLGGDSETSQALEQTGTEADCNANGAISYSAWYELVPAASVRVSLKVAPGDKIYGAAHVSGTEVTVQLKNLTRRTSFAKTLSMASPDLSSAEWIAEAPSTCRSVGRCRELSLTNFGAVKFSSASATTSDGHVGTISDPSWAADAITLDATQANPFSHFGMNAGAAQASPSPLSATGNAFSVTWAATSTLTPAPAPAPTDPPGSDPAPLAV
jgi:hypothetical protein